jgi:hypothetical protein
MSGRISFKRLVGRLSLVGWLMLLGSGCGNGEEAQTGSFYLVNDSAVEVCYLFISPSTSGVWGNDRLGEGNTLLPGDTFVVTDVPVGDYDFKVQDCTGTDSATSSGYLGTAGLTWTLSHH